VPAALRTAFQNVFGVEGHRTLEQRVVWAWLTAFCRKQKSTLTDGPEFLMYLEGRREVLLEIERKMGITPETVDQILKVVMPEPNEDNTE
jgi:hypothetical protein